MASASSVALLPRMMRAGSLGVKSMMANTKKVAPIRTGIAINILLIMYRAMITVLS